MLGSLTDPDADMAPFPSRNVGQVPLLTYVANRQMPTFVTALARHVEAVTPACDAAPVAWAD